MALVTLEEILKETGNGKYAVGAFDVMGPIPTFAEGVLAAAEKRDVPVILMVVEWTFGTRSCAYFMDYLVSRCRAASVPVCIHLDHGSNFEAVMHAIKYGCTSVMLDASAMPMAENIRETQRVVEVAHACGISVEAEIGHVAGQEGNMLEGNTVDESAYTQVADAQRFYESTGVDALAVAFGTVHGVYKGVPKLDLTRLDEIRKAVGAPLVMHGGSGLKPEDFRAAIAHGISKINFFTGINLGASQAVYKALREKDGKIGFETLGEVALAEIERVSGEHMDIFGTRPLTVR